MLHIKALISNRDITCRNVPLPWGASIVLLLFLGSVAGSFEFCSCTLSSKLLGSHLSDSLFLMSSKNTHTPIPPHPTCKHFRCYLEWLSIRMTGTFSDLSDLCFILWWRALARGLGWDTGWPCWPRPRIPSCKDQFLCVSLAEVFLHIRATGGSFLPLGFLWWTADLSSVYSGLFQWA